MELEKLIIHRVKIIKEEIEIRIREYKNYERVSKEINFYKSLAKLYK